MYCSEMAAIVQLWLAKVGRVPASSVGAQALRVRSSVEGAGPLALDQLGGEATCHGVS